MSRRWIPVLVLALFFLMPDVAHACPVCFDPRDQSNGTFLASTAFLSLFPLGMLGSAGLWLRKRLRDARSGEQEEDSEE
jgi:hypothetical protein